MADHTYTLGELKLAVQHALGKPPNMQLVNATDYVNDAIQALSKMHSWNWLRSEITIDTTSGTAEYSLPADFMSMQFLYREVDTGVPSGLEEIKPMFPAQPYEEHSTYKYVIHHETQASGTGLPTPKITLYPAPAFTDSPGLRGVYIRRIQALTTDANIPDIPAQYHELLKQYVRAHAMIEDHTPNYQVEYERFLKQLEFAKILDASAQKVGNSA